MEVKVLDNNVDQALKVLKRKLQKEGVLREVRNRQHYMKPSEVKAKMRAAAQRRSRKKEATRVLVDSGLKK